jgi:hypothetical protein
MVSTHDRRTGPRTSGRAGADGPDVVTIEAVQFLRLERETVEEIVGTPVPGRPAVEETDHVQGRGPERRVSGGVRGKGRCEFFASPRSACWQGYTWEACANSTLPMALVLGARMPTTGRHRSQRYFCSHARIPASAIAALTKAN